MIRPPHLWPVAGLFVFSLVVSPIVRGDPPATAPAVTLPLTRVTLYTAGVGYFHRGGPIDGDARTELRFPEADVNDLLKSLVLTDAGGGKPRAVTYDTRAPVEFTLKSFAVDLTDNPTVGQLLHQVRGERVSVTDKAGVTADGMVVSVERPGAGGMAPDPGEQLNLLTADGLTSVELKQTRKIQFARPGLQAEFRKALEVLAGARGDGRKGVGVVFGGKGKRDVSVGYVVEAPVWKATYRLGLGEKGAARLQGWASVENTTDEDWTNVKVALVAGRPLSFRMDLYDPLFVPRPTVEPDLFASLRPPLYQGGLSTVTPIGMMGNAGVAAGMGNPNVQNPGGNFLGIQGGGLGIQGGNLGQLGGHYGFQGGNFSGFGGYAPRTPRPDVRDLYGSRLSYSDFIERTRGNLAAGRQGSEQAVNGPETVRDPFDPNKGVLAAAEGGRLGDAFRYAIDDPVTLPRQKAALVPIVSEAVESQRVSIFNAKVLDKHPLLGLKLVNKTKKHLAQGPVTVYDGETFAGDARLPDLAPNETRLVSYAIDLGTEVKVFYPLDLLNRSTLLTMKVRAGNLVTATRERKTTRYLLRSRDAGDRTVVIEHAATDGWRLTAPAGLAERTRTFYRFEVAAKAGEAKTLDVVEETDGGRTDYLTTLGDDGLTRYAEDAIASPAVRAVLAKVRELRGTLSAARKGLDEEQAALKEIADEQTRIRANIERVPKDSDAHKRYLKKFDDQETEIERRQARVKALKLEASKAEAALREYVEGAKAE